MRASAVVTHTRRRVLTRAATARARVHTRMRRVRTVSASRAHAASDNELDSPLAELMAMDDDLVVPGRDAMIQVINISVQHCPTWSL